MAQGKISAKQLEILEYIKSQILERGFPPSVRDICEAVHLKSTSSVHSHLETLEKNGYIRRVLLPENLSSQNRILRTTSLFLWNTCQISRHLC